MELNIYFKNVGQGDTIVMDWELDTPDKKAFALIDCNLVDNKIVSLIKHIENHKIKEFEFVLMSHPHFDHFSGFDLFFKYCELNKIVIKKFLHTSAFNPAYLKILFDKQINEPEFKNIVSSSVNRIAHKDKLISLYKQLNKASKKKTYTFIKDIQVINNDYLISLNDAFCIKFLAPFQDDIERYINSTYKYENNDKVSISQKTENNPHANLLSSLLLIYSPKKKVQLMLSSDATKYTFKRLLNNSEHFKFIQDNKLIAAQIPHHGSHHNHVEEFWEKIIKPDTTLFVSVGEGYGHPDTSVIEYFGMKGVEIHSTNFVGGYKEHYTKKKAATDSRILKSIFSMAGVPINKGAHQSNSQCPACCEKHLRIVIENDDDYYCFINDII